MYGFSLNKKLNTQCVERDFGLFFHGALVVAPKSLVVQ
jgi:hypothetical protein